MKNRVLRQRVRRTAIVTLKSGAAFRGALWESDERCLVLRNCEQVEAGGDRIPTPVDGELLLLAADVLLVQFP